MFQAHHVEQAGVCNLQASLWVCREFPEGSAALHSECSLGNLQSAFLGLVACEWVSCQSHGGNY